jgi:hypothetical protein
LKWLKYLQCLFRIFDLVFLPVQQEPELQLQ